MMTDRGKSNLVSFHTASKFFFVFSILLLLIIAAYLICPIEIYASPLSSSGSKNQYVWSKVKSIVAVGDLHGDYDSFVLILKGTGIVDDDLHWKAGKTHLVQIGDIMDRGDKARDIFDLIMRLEEEAVLAGGYVHMLLGNHEEANLTGIAIDYEGYVTLGQFLSFLPEKFKEKKEKHFLRKNKISSKDQMDAQDHQKLVEFWQDVLYDARTNPLSSAREEYTRNFINSYGQWIMDHNAAIKINNILFVHGGISERYSDWGLEEINERLRRELKEYSHAVLYKQPPVNQPLILYMPDGPLWYRELAMNDEPGLEEVLDRILQKLDAERMIIAHTPSIEEGNMVNRFNGKVWLVDTGISEFYRKSGGRIRALVIKSGKFSVWKPPTESSDQVPLKQGGVL